MREDVCSYELSFALKKAGFDEPCDHYYAYDEKSKIKHLLISASPSEWDWNYSELPEFVHPECSAPHIYHAQKWLRNKYGLHVTVCPCMDSASDADGQVCDEWQFWFFDVMQVSTARFLVDGEGRFDSYEQALSEGIKSALELTKKGE